MTNAEETSRWEPVKELMAGAAPVTLGPMHAYHMARTPRRLLYTLSYYKFAAKMIGREGRAEGQGPRPKGQGAEPETSNPQTLSPPHPLTSSPPHPNRVLDIGCGEGLGTWLLAAECGFAKGVDFDADLIAVAQKNWPGDKAEFTCEDVLTMKGGKFDAAVSFDVIEHILPANADAFLRGIAAQLTPYGLAIIGTPNVTSAPYASAVTNAGHVNLYDAARLEAEMRRHFHQVFMFGANDEVVHTGFAPMCHYLIAMGVRRRALGC